MYFIILLSATKMDKDKVKYILNYHSSLMAKGESMAWRHWSTTYKMEHSDSTPQQKESRREVSLKAGWLTEDENILSLLKDGIDEFEKRVACRIVKSEKIEFNNCTQCGKLARTPKAKQCRFCGYDWH